MRPAQARVTRWVIAPLAVAAILCVFRPAVLSGPERGTYDLLLRAAPVRPPDSRVVIVDIDDRSLSTVGQWPWRRDVLGRLAAEIRSRGASAVALDVLLAEEERSTPASPSTDAALAETLKAGRIVLGYALTFDRKPSAHPACQQRPLNVVIVRPGSGDDNDPLFQATSGVCSLPMLTRAATNAGFLNAAPDSDGILRRVPLLLELDGRIYPSLPLAAVQTALGASADATLRIANANAVSMTFAGRAVPLDGRSHLLLRYRGKKHTFQYVSAADVLNGNVPQDAFAGRIVFVGTTALGTREVVATPLDTLFAAVEVHATVADNLLRQDYFRRTEHAVALETLFTVGLGLLAVMFVHEYGLTRAAAMVAAGAAALWIGGAALLSLTGMFVSPLYPSAGAAGTFLVIAGARLRSERRRADLAVADTAASRQMMIQSLLSLTETRDPETGAHSRRTQRTMSILAAELASTAKYRAFLTPERIELLSTLAPLHDIGKVGIADRVLGKPGVLTKDELVEMRRHPVLGRDVIARAEQEIGVDRDGVMALAKEIVYTHHEKWDGTGYPQGLRGDEIPVAGRLMAVVDVYDAVIGRRRYQQPVSHDDAARLIVDGRGTHFDPAVVDAFVRVAASLRYVYLHSELETNEVTDAAS